MKNKNSPHQKGDSEVKVSDLSLEITTNELMDEFLDRGACGVSLVARTSCSAGGQNPCIAI